MHVPLGVESATSRWIIAALTLAVLVLVGLVLFAPTPAGAHAASRVLPTLNALLNGSAAAFLLAGYVFIRRRNVRAHRACMLTAFVLSSLFLVGYLAHHRFAGSVPFRGTGAVRALYLSILTPHVILAAIVVPLALFTIYRGWTLRIAQHRRIARWTLPIWLYVSVSGVLVYLMLYQLRF